MPTLSNLKKFIDYLVENHPEVAEECTAAEHDRIYLPTPSTHSIEEMVEKAKEFGIFASEEYDSLVIFT